MSPRASRALATTLALLTLAMTVVAMVFLVPDSAVLGSEQLGSIGVAIVILAVTFSIVGWLIAARRSENRIGWMFLVSGFLYALTAFSEAYAGYGLLAVPGSLPLADVMSWLSILTWVPALMLLILLLLFFPDGRLPSRRWRPVVWIAGTAGVLMLAPSAVALWPYRGLLLLAAEPAMPTNDTAPATAQLLGTFGFFISLFVAAAGAVALVTRFRRSIGTERQQIKWFATAAVIEVTLLNVMTGVQLPPPFNALVALLIPPLIPIATGVAILRYRLYDIDRIISRTVSYGAVTGILAVVYVGTILVSQTVLSSFFRGNSVAVAASTLVVAALFQPLRRRVQSVVDRRFNRSRYDAERTVAAFGERLRDQVDLASLSGDIAGVVDSTLHPSQIGVWLRAPGRDVSHSTTP